VPGALNIGLGGQFASWAGSLVSPETPVILVADGEASVDEAVMRLARVGLERVEGYLDGGMNAWDKAGLEVRTVAQWPVDELQHHLEAGAALQVLDVRRPAEYATGHIPGAQGLSLAQLEAGLGSLSPELPTAVICGSGYRSSAATSLMARRGFRDLYNIVGGTTAWKNAGYPVDEPAGQTDCPRAAAASQEVCATDQPVQEEP
jgi:hydroxyacylglutathione hydrolase